MTNTHVYYLYIGGAIIFMKFLTLLCLGVVS